jgi:hypothetical protein
MLVFPPGLLEALQLAAGLGMLDAAIAAFREAGIKLEGAAAAAAAAAAGGTGGDSLQPLQVAQFLEGFGQGDCVAAWFNTLAASKFAAAHPIPLSAPDAPLLWSHGDGYVCGSLRGLLQQAAKSNRTYLNSSSSDRRSMGMNFSFIMRKVPADAPPADQQYLSDTVAPRLNPELKRAAGRAGAGKGPAAEQPQPVRRSKRAAAAQCSKGVHKKVAAVRRQPVRGGSKRQ